MHNEITCCKCSKQAVVYLNPHYYCGRHGVYETYRGEKYNAIRQEGKTLQEGIQTTESQRRAS
tara:strand:+ start:1301 stop:1489 length:189 start_codon:yes stop_codon:yes gene_type:complete